MRRLILFLAFALAAIAPQTGVAQVIWERYLNPPVLVPGAEGEWNEAQVSHPCVLPGSMAEAGESDYRYHLWYAGEDGAQRGIGYARSRDGAAWEDYPGNPVLADGAGSAWDGSYVSQPSVVYDGSGYHLWYAGFDGERMEIGHATSADGLSWVKSASNPVLTVGGSGSWDGAGVSSPSVVYDGSGYHLWYSGFDGERMEIGYATSADGLSWVKEASNPVLGVGDSGSWDGVGVSSPSVVYDGSGYHLWYTGGEGIWLNIGYVRGGMPLSGEEVLPLEEGTIVLDFDLADGDQEQRAARDVKAGAVYTLQLNVDDAPEIKGWSTFIEYDPTQLRYVANSFETTDFLSGFFSLEDEDEGRVNIGGSTFTAGVQNSGDASLAVLQFETLDGFADSTEVVITEISFNHVDKVRDVRVVRSVALLSDELASIGIAGDFDGDDNVGFGDFFLFADAFGGTDPRFDLDGDGSVGFGDFFLFADNFGKTGSAKLMALARQYLGLPVSSHLAPNYPNPFNSATRIPYQVVQSGAVELRVFALTGQQVRTLVHAVQQPGSYQAAWDGTDARGEEVSTGVYLLRFTTGVYSETRKMTLVK